MKWNSDKVTISDEAKRRFQEMCDAEMSKRQEEVEIINVEITQKENDYMLYFAAGIVATVSFGMCGYFIGMIIF